MAEKEFRKSAILSSDIAGISKAFSSASAEAFELLAWHHEAAKKVCAANCGRLVSATADLCLMEFPSPLDALRAAIEMRSEFDKKKLGDSTRSCELRIGIDYGDAHFFNDAAFGEPVDTANRLRMEASAGSTKVTSRVRDLVAAKYGSDFIEAGSIKSSEGQKPTAIFELGSRDSDERPRNVGAPNEIAQEKYAENFNKISGVESDSTSTLVSLRKAILDETKSRGTRMTVGEAKAKYAYYGPEAYDVIASLADSGILIKDQPRTRSGSSIPQYSYSASDLGKSIETAVHSIVSEIERAVGENIAAKNERRRGSAGLPEEGGASDWLRYGKDWNYSRDEWRKARHEFRETRRRTRDGVRGSAGSDVARSSFDTYSSGLLEKARKSRHSLISNIISYSIVNSVFWKLNATIAHQYPWAIFVSVFWGIGVLDNIVSSIRLSRQSREAQALPELDSAQLAEYKAINKRRDALAKHFVSTLSISAALFAVNSLTSAATPWFIIPSAFLAVSLLVDAVSYAATIPSRVKRFFASFGAAGGRKGLEKVKDTEKQEAGSMGPYASLYREAKDISRELEEDFKAADPGSIDEIKPELENYLGQVKLLSQTANELDSIIGAIPIESLKADKAKLKKKLSEAPESLSAEYSSSIAEIEKQEDSFKALQDQREVIDLRLKSSINKLRQLQLDLANTRAASMGNGDARSSAALDAVKSRTDELSRYIEDLKAGKLETLEDPFEALERAEAEKKNRLE